jgi:hypothetical protein
LYRNLSSYFLAHFFIKKFAKVLRKLSSALIWEILTALLLVPTFFGDRFVDQEGGLRKHNPSATEEGGLEAFLDTAALNFDLG